jgi:hypothetical protein
MAQELRKVTLTNDGQFDAFTFYLGEAVVLQVSKDGQINKWGVDVYESLGRNDNFQDRLDPYTGKTGNYTIIDDSAYRDKLKFIGRVYITWYASYENEFLRGKIKSIGNIPITYYEQYEDEAFRGNIKTIGSQTITWYRSFENELLKGKLKSVGYTQLKYYGPVDDKAFRGKIKSIGNTSYTYYSSFDRQGYAGGRKTGEQTVAESGVKFQIKW